MQVTFGKENQQISIDTVVLEVKQTVSRMEEIFTRYDEQVYELFGEIIDSKVNEKEDKNNKVRFKSQKVFESLMKIGIPLENAYQIVIYVLNNIVIHEKNGLYDGKILSTHIIRKIVAYEILHCDLDGIPLKTVEEWGDKYVRRYGHDSKRIKIYYKGSSQEDDLSYVFVKDTLLCDIAAELGIDQYTYGGKIRKGQLKSMSEDIVDFINNCNLYRIRYDVLKSYVCEMVLQPPHPWLVTAETADVIRKYDIDAVDKHYLRVKDKLDANDYSEEYFTICEMLHHTSSSILAGYREVLGCKDLDAFANLENIVSQMYNGEQDLILEYNIAELPSDLKYIGVNFSDFYWLLERIHLNIENRNREFKITRKFLQDIVELHDIAVALYEKTNKQQMENFLFSSWDNYSEEEKKNYIKLFFAVIDYRRVGKSLTKADNCFWFDADAKGNHVFLVVYLEEMDFVGLNSFLNELKVQKILESVLIVVENEKYKSLFFDGISKLDSSKIIVEFLYKEELQRIFNSVNKLNELDMILKEKLILWE